MRSPNYQQSTRVDLTNCDREPIHILGHVQNYGCLVAVSSDWMVSHASANCAQMLGVEAADFVGRPIADIFTQRSLHDVRTRMQVLSQGNQVARIFGLDLKGDGRLYDISIHQSGRNFIFEFEPKDMPGLRRDELSLLQPLVARLRRRDTLQDVMTEAARAIRALTGFGRVMVYRFGADKSGQVVAEARDARLESYMGLRFPASDIPAQARELYRRSLLRIITDVNGETHPIVPELGADGEPLDLSLSVTRAVSPIHLEYLRNMGVASSMSVSILRNGDLWGLFACHNDAPLYIDYEKRSTVELFTQLFAYELGRIESAAEIDDAARARKLHDTLMTQVSSGLDLRRSFDLVLDEIGEVIDFDGAALYVDGDYVARGSAPTEAEFSALARFLNTATASQIFATDHIASRHPDAKGYSAHAAGLLALPVSRRPRDYLVLFRREVARSVRWAGNPDKPVDVGPNGIRLTPRKSFEAWKEVVTGRSAPWSNSELRTAEALRVTLLEVVLKLADEAEAAARRAAEQKTLLINELNHRVRNILHLIRSLVVQTRQGAEGIESYASVLDSRIQALARAHDQLTDQNWGWSSLQRLIRNEVDAFLGHRRNGLRLQGPTVDLNPTAFTAMALVIHELATNSVKYGAMGAEGGHVEVALTPQPDGSLALSWIERGGPAVQPPKRQGFGSTVIERTIPHELRGTAEVSYRVTGLEARFSLPGSTWRTGAGGLDLVPDAAPSAATPLDIGTVLVVEDNMIIAMDAADTLEEIGATQVHTAATVRQALDVLEREDISIALLDVNLGEETSLPIAQACAQSGVPMILATGYGSVGDVIETYPPHRAVIRKPFSHEDIVRALSGNPRD